MILVRNQIVNKRNIFRILQDPEVASHWEERIIRFLETRVAQIITVVLDKEAFIRTGQPSELRPYSYCIDTLTGIYDQWLGMVGGAGDVMAESRGKKEDKGLEEDFHRYMTQGSRQSVSSNHIKLKLKTSNITGLQLADLLAYSFKRGILMDNGLFLSNPPSPATLRFIETLRTKSNLHSVVLP